MRVAVLGLGRMGRALAERLLETGHEVTVWNRTPGRTTEVAASVARQAPDPGAAVEGVEVAVTLLAADDAVRAVALGPAGLLAALPPTAVYVDASTVSPETSRALADGAGDGRFVAMPVLGSPSAVRSGEATVLLGGAAATVDRLTGLCSDVAARHRHVGTPEQALALKLASNLLLLAEVTALTEAVAVARSADLPTETLREFFAASPMLPPGVRNRLDAVLDRDHGGWWSVQLAAKDARLAAEAAQRHGCELPLARAVQRRLEEAAGRGLAEADLTAVAELLAD